MSLRAYLRTLLVREEPIDEAATPDSLRQERTPLGPGTPDVPTAGSTAPTLHNDTPSALDKDVLSEPEMLRKPEILGLRDPFPSLEQDSKHHSPGCDDSGVFLEDPVLSSPETPSRSGRQRDETMRQHALPEPPDSDADDLGLASSSVDSADDLEPPPPVPARKPPLSKSSSSGEDSTFGEATFCEKSSSQESKSSFLARTLSSSTSLKQQLEVPTSSLKWKSEECLRTAAENKWSLPGRRYEKSVSVKDRIAMFSEMESNQTPGAKKDLQRYGSENNIKATTVEVKIKPDASATVIDDRKTNSLLRDSKWQSMQNIDKKRENPYTSSSSIKPSLSIPSLLSTSPLDNSVFPIKLDVEPPKPIVSTYPETQLTNNKRYNYGLYSLKNLKNTEDFLSKKAAAGSNLLSIIDARKQPLRKLKGLVIPDKPLAPESGKTLPTLVSSDSESSKDCRRASLPITVVTACSNSSMSLPRRKEPPWKAPKYCPKRGVESLSPTPPSSLTSPLSPSSPSSVCSSTSSLQQNVFQFSLSHSKPVKPLRPEKALMSPSSEDAPQVPCEPKDEPEPPVQPAPGAGLLQYGAPNVFTSSSSKSVALQPLLVEALAKSPSPCPPPRAAVCISKTEIHLRRDGPRVGSLEGEVDSPTKMTSSTTLDFSVKTADSRTTADQCATPLSMKADNRTIIDPSVTQLPKTDDSRTTADYPVTHLLKTDDSRTRIEYSVTQLTKTTDFSASQLSNKDLSRTTVDFPATALVKTTDTRITAEYPATQLFNKADNRTAVDYSMTQLNKTADFSTKDHGRTTVDYSVTQLSKTTDYRTTADYSTTNGRVAIQNESSDDLKKTGRSSPEVPSVGKFRASPLHLSRDKSRDRRPLLPSDSDDDSHHTTTDDCLSDADSFEKPLRTFDDSASTEGYLSDASTDVSLRRFAHRPASYSAEEYLSDATAESPDPDWVSNRATHADARYRGHLLTSESCREDSDPELRPKRLSQQRTVLRASVEPSGSVQKFKALAEKWEQRVVSPPPVAAPPTLKRVSATTLQSTSAAPVSKGKGSLPPSLMPRSVRPTPPRASPTTPPETNGWSHHEEMGRGTRSDSTSSDSSKTTVKEEDMPEEPMFPVHQETSVDPLPKELTTPSLSNGHATPNSPPKPSWNNEPRNRRGADFSWSSRPNFAAKNSVSDIRRSFENGHKDPPVLAKKPTTPAAVVGPSPVVVAVAAAPRTASPEMVVVVATEDEEVLLEAARRQLQVEGCGQQSVLAISLLREGGMDGGSVGITLAGGADYEVKEITVHKVISGSIADRDGRIQKGDRLMSINGRDLRGVSHGEALHILKSPNPRVMLVVARSTQMQHTAPKHNRPPLTDAESFLVELQKDATGLGFSIEGGKDSPQGDRALLIKRVFKGGAADKEGQLGEGDEIMFVNSHPMTNMTRTEAWNYLKKLPEGPVRLQLRKNRPLNFS